MMFSSAILALTALATSANAAIYVTSPVASSAWTAGSQQTISWQDDGTTPSLQSFGSAKITLSVGNAIQQTPLQVIVPSVDVSTTSSVVFTPDPSVGGSGNMYFIRIESLSLKDAAQPQYPALGFSAKFTLSGMSGTFNSTVQAEINGASTAPIGPTSSAAPTTPSSTAASSSKVSSSASATSHSSAASASGSAVSAAKSGAVGIVTSGAAAVLGSVAAVVGAMML